MIGRPVDQWLERQAEGVPPTEYEARAAEWSRRGQRSLVRVWLPGAVFLALPWWWTDGIGAVVMLGHVVNVLFCHHCTMWWWRRFSRWREVRSRLDGEVVLRPGEKATFVIPTKP